MTPEQQRIKLAEWDGMTRCSVCPCGCGDSHATILGGENGFDRAVKIPNYPEDLNAVHGLLLKLTEDQLWKCIEHLVGWKPATPHGFPILSRSESIKLATATAGEWCKALLKTIGLWEESE